MKKNGVLSAEQAPSLNKDAEIVLSRHLQSFIDNDLDTLMSDYTEQSVLITHQQTCKGIQQIRAFFTEIMKFFPKNQSSFDLDKLETNNELVFIVWHATTPSLEVPLATDTFIIREGKIQKQTFAGQMNFLS